jgi:hypothetical protein
MFLASQVLVTFLLASYCGATLEVLLALQTHFRSGCVHLLQSQNTTGNTHHLPFTDEAQTALFKDPVRTAL